MAAGPSFAHRVIRHIAIGLTAASVGSVASAGQECSGIGLPSVLGNDPVLERNSASIVRVVFPDSGSCTGTLVNNVLGDGRPLILTARHCLTRNDANLDERPGDTEIVYTRRSCLLGSCLFDRHITTQGASVRMAWGDLMLLEAWERPPTDARAHYAGLSLHEPERDAFGLHYAAASLLQWIGQRYEGNSRFFVLTGGSGDHPTLGVRAWETTLTQGATPPGSSGSALMGPAGHIHGVLSTGNSCTNNRDINLYQKVGDAWTGGDTPATSLRYWIDPAEVGAVVIDGEKAARMSETDPLPPDIIVNDFVESPAGSSGGGSAGWTFLGMTWLAALGGLQRCRRRMQADES